MSKILTIEKLCKTYPKFKLDDVSFSVEEGTIMGFIGRNGAGKTTTLKALMNLVQPDSGEICFFGQSLKEHEKEIKQQIGYAAGGVQYYQRKRLKDIAAMTGSFYSNWDEAAYRNYLERFGLDENKKPIELSEGMKVKFNLTLALSHHAKMLILDEPTSGLDPVSREDLLEVFLELAGEGVAILFSTHITSDLDKCADEITYIQKGNILASKKTEDFINSYRLVDINLEEGKNMESEVFLGICRSRDGGTGLIEAKDAGLFQESKVRLPSLEEIMVHLEREGGTL